MPRHGGLTMLLHKLLEKIDEKELTNKLFYAAEICVRKGVDWSEEINDVHSYYEYLNVMKFKQPLHFSAKEITIWKELYVLTEDEWEQLKEVQSWVI